LRILLSTLLLAAASFGLAASARAGAVVPYPIREETLPNGLRVVLIKTPHEGVAAYYTLVRTGSRNEIEPGHSGFAHLFEHMMFRGTKTYSSDARDAELMKMGVSDNAFTSDDVTVYTNYGPAKALPKLIEIEADRFQNLEYSEPAFQTETKAVLGEYNKNFADPSQKLEEIICDLAFTKHTYKHTTMGFLEDIKAMPTMYEYSKSFFSRWYRPDNCVVFVVGGFDPDQIFGHIKTHYGPWSGSAAKIEIPVEPKQTAEKRHHHDWDTPTQPRLMVGYHTPGCGTLAALKEGAIQNVLAQYLLGQTSPAYKTLVLDRQIAERIEPWYNDHRDARLWHYQVVLKDRNKSDEALAFIDQSIAELAAGKVDEKRVKDALSAFRYGLSMQMETPADLAVNLAVMTGLTGDVGTLDRLAEEVARLTSGDLVAFAKKHLTPANRTVITLATREES
jgi:zinc protease